MNRNLQRSVDGYVMIKNIWVSRVTILIITLLLSACAVGISEPFGFKQDLAPHSLVGSWSEEGSQEQDLEIELHPQDKSKLILQIPSENLNVMLEFYRFEGDDFFLINSAAIFDTPEVSSWFLVYRFSLNGNVLTVEQLNYERLIADSFGTISYSLCNLNRRDRQNIPQEVHQCEIVMLDTKKFWDAYKLSDEKFFENSFMILKMEEDG